ncbi:HAMP domain-containing histidine kinase [Paracoccus caeni]|uniref:Signal transduction histidine-protein kinase/phosphatase MprB n=1 Tax=Paracoccus caeni TaxID=657651 RepID=A0A934S947_9RHOB|nr:HAMP domain-containing sensor histidine kinase [Paracoccus caeni]MBK4214416.1 HAMP domain-containing histidine kinase [Paracoccus caeni]
MTRRWRPSLAFVLGGALIGTLALSFWGLVLLRVIGPEIGFRQAAMLLATLIACATAVLGLLQLRLLLRPIRALAAYAEAQEGTVAPIPPPRHFGTRELQAMASRVIAMAEALREREATVRTYTDHVTHELKSPVAAIRAASELLSDGGDLTEVQQRLLSEIDGARQQIKAQLAALRDAAQAREASHRGSTTLSALTEILEAGHPALALRFVGAEELLPLSADGLRIILDQLLRNAAEHGATSVELRVGLQDGRLFLTVQDNGRGISAGNAGRIFEPFFTTRRDTGGTGMGLTIVRNLLVAHGGRLALVQAPNGDLSHRFCLKAGYPLPDAPVSPDRPAGPAADCPGAVRSGPEDGPRRARSGWSRG